MRARYRACILSLLVPLALQGQDIGLLRLDPETGNRGKAGVYGGYEAGGYHPAFAPASLWKAGASAQGTHHGEYTSYTGSFSFEQIEGKDQFMSMFLEPGYFPVDVLEFTPGDKTRQTYKLGGGFATTFAEEFVFGVKADYLSANYAKRKDIRHTTYGMDLQVEPTFAVVSDDIGISVAYVFRKRTETIDAEQVGAATDQSYFAFLDKGMRYGTYQVWDGDGIHLDEAGVGLLPVRENGQGLALQLATRPFNGKLTVLWKQGSAGEKGYTWFRFPGFSFTDELFGFHEAGAFTGRWGLGIRLESDQLEESVLEKRTEGGVTVPVVHAFNKVSHRTHGRVDASYGMAFRRGMLRDLKAALQYIVWEEESYLGYPYTDRLDLSLGSALVEAGFEAGRFRLDLGGRFGLGGKQEKGLGEVLEEAPVQPFRLQGDWDRKMEYMTATRCGAEARLTWRPAFLPGAYIAAEGSWLHGFNLTVLPGSDRICAGLRLGYGF